MLITVNYANEFDKTLNWQIYNNVHNTDKLQLSKPVQLNHVCNINMIKSYFLIFQP